MLSLSPKPGHISTPTPQLLMRSASNCYLHCGDVLSREGIGSVADEQACFTHSPRRTEEGRDKDKTMIRTEDCCSIYSLSFNSYGIFLIDI